MVKQYVLSFVRPVKTKLNWTVSNQNSRTTNLSYIIKYLLILTLIHRTPYRFSYQPTWQCENHIWISSAGNVSISFLLWRGDRGHGVHCEGVQRKAGAEGGSSGSIQPERCVLLRSFYTLFAHFLPQNNVKERLLRSINERNNLLHFSGRILLQICLYSTLLSWKCASSPAVH